MKLKKLLLILTCCALLCCALVLASCDQEKTPSETESPTEAVTDGEQPPVEDDTITDPFYVVKDGAPIRIVYPLIYEDALYKHANTLASNIKNLTGVKPVVVDDVSAGRNGYDENSAEILIGYTAYETSKQAFAELADYSQCKIKVTGNKLVVASYDSDAINSAVTKLTLLLNVARVFAFRVPVLWFLQKFTDMGAEAVGVTMMVSNVCVGITAVVVAIPVLLKIRRLIREEEEHDHAALHR
jgi:hypothetical protein